jgi:beta-1,4-N-acetylglucosaminyltransferase
MKVMLVASTGGHLSQLLQLKQWWSQDERHWVTFQKEDAVSALDGETVTWAYHPTTRNVPNALRNLRLAWTTLRDSRPDLVVSTGAGVAVPFFVVSRLMGIHTAYIEVFDRISRPTLTGGLCYPITDAFCLQWQEQAKSYPDGQVVGWLT